ncbi:hypothetical protein GQX74_008696 [Glossina fuscipes]|nr:hypothetical protein GQX74_008696 [Glossina fuscipes]
MQSSGVSALGAKAPLTPEFCIANCLACIWLIVGVVQAVGALSTLFIIIPTSQLDLQNGHLNIICRKSRIKFVYYLSLCPYNSALILRKANKNVSIFKFNQGTVHVTFELQHNNK